MDTLRRVLLHSRKALAIENVSSISVGSTSASYADVVGGAERLAARAARLMPTEPNVGPAGPRVACLCEPGVTYVQAMLSCWMNGGTFVPLSPSHPSPLLEYTLEDAQASVVISEKATEGKLRGLSLPACVTSTLLADEIVAERGTARVLEHVRVDESRSERGALILYTSGTTGQPKGVLHSHRSLAAQVSALCHAWEWNERDHMLHTLPLHHIHGLVNGLLCAMHSGASLSFARFDARRVWRRLAHGNFSVYMGVPTMYAHLLSALRVLPHDDREAALSAARALRLAVSGSAACPVPIIEEWHSLTGQILLERYGMTEVGMALSNPYSGRRVPGTVGVPLPSVEVELSREGPTALQSGTPNLPSSHASCAPEDPRRRSTGELLVRGPSLFSEYWRRVPETAAAFDERGFFATGDMVETVEVDGDSYFCMLGRTSVDIIKSGGFKLSALRIESILLSHPSIEQAAVLGLPSDVYGEVVACMLVLTPGGNLDPQQLRAWAANLLSPSEIPKVIKFVEDIPKNAMGKVNKKVLKSLL